MVELNSFSIHIPFEWVWAYPITESMPKQHKRKRTKWKNRKKKWA